nr:MAG TPA: hypothetical protein [Caudoviricetes sp.]
MEDTSDREILISSQYNSMMSLVIFRIAYDTCLIKPKIIQRLIHWLYPIIPLTHCSLYLIIYICGVVTHNVLSNFQPKGKGVREDAFFIPAHPTMTKRSTSNKYNHNKATVKKKPYRYSIADRVLQRCIKLNHITPFDCVTDEAPHRQIPYERRPFRGVRVFQISQDSLDYFLVAIQYLRKVVAIEHSEQVLDISPSGVIRFLGPAFIEHLLSVLHRPSSLGPVGVKHLVSGSLASSLEK